MATHSGAEFVPRPDKDKPKSKRRSPARRRVDAYETAPCKCPPPRKHAHRCRNKYPDCPCCQETCKCPFEVEHVCPCEGTGDDRCPEAKFRCKDKRGVCPCEGTADYRCEFRQITSRCKCAKGGCRCPASWKSKPCPHVLATPIPKKHTCGHGARRRKGCACCEDRCACPELTLDELAILQQEADPDPENGYAPSKATLYATSELPGTQAKMRVMMIRLEDGEAVDNPNDARAPEDANG